MLWILRMIVAAICFTVSFYGLRWIAGVFYSKEVTPADWVIAICLVYFFDKYAIPRFFPQGKRKIKCENPNIPKVPNTWF